MDVFFIISMLFILGLIGGFIAGLLGIGGGIIFVPMMVMLFSLKGMPSDLITHMAIATTMATILFTVLSSVRIHHRYQAVEWPLVFTISPGLLIGTLIGGKVFNWLHTGSLTLLFSVFVGFSGWQMLRSREKSVTPVRNLPPKATLICIGTSIGFICSLVGVGGGFISVPFLIWCNLPIRRAIATSAAFGIPIAALATLNNIYYGYGLPNLPKGSLGYVYLPALVCIATASVFAAPFGAKMTHKINTSRLKIFFAMLLFILSFYMLVQGIKAYR